MTKREALNGKPYAGNPHVRFDEGEAASTATSRRGSLLYKKLLLVACIFALHVMIAGAAVPFRLGVAGYTFRERTVDDALAIMQLAHHHLSLLGAANRLQQKQLITK